jgi:F-type H+-transporting ATPase subunit epsilon
MADDKVDFELVAPERLVMAAEADMVVVPGAEGNFGVLPGHSLLISVVRPGVIDIYEGNAVKDSVFVAGGIAEVTPERCTVLASEAIAVADIDRAAVDAQIKDLREDIAEAGNDRERQTAEAALHVAEAKIAALDHAG